MTQIVRFSCPPVPGRLFIARHGETVFNAAKRLQGDHLHTPLTRAGFAQSDAMGTALAQVLGPRPSLTLWASDSGRALQTLAVITEHLALDWHDATADRRLLEIGMGSWGGRYYADVIAEVGPVIEAPEMLLKCAPDGETYPQIADRVIDWLAEHADTPGDRLVIMHGISSRVLRGVLLGLPPHPVFGAPVAPGLPQGSVVMIAGGREVIVVTGTGGGHA
ncbi:histidine phosphatase family protein [Blastomonas aquatica]|uniref:Phosphoglycerate mutase n=1 Tax=Blastomonas aquatica TaxID=1510276 RepID=A0ABQ1JC79_9SPHN|nr:histidine phosphatase family protein [Blastomonas aquatica]GGB65216.1 phosphoglycerate mutase [Blastomonas aquatica]